MLLTPQGMKPPMRRHLCCCLLMTMPFVATAAPLTLVRDGQPAATIILATNATRAAQLGAFELQAHLRDMTGATLPITNETATAAGTQILVGDSGLARRLGVRADKLKSQEYLIQFHRQTLVLAGRDQADTGPVNYDYRAAPQQALASWPGLWDERGTLHACYDFLEKYCGVRWFNPTEFGADIPQLATLTVTGRSLRRSPSFRYRDALPSYSNVPERYDGYTALWPAASEEFNACEAAAYPQLRARFTHASAYVTAKRAQVRLFQLRRREGGEPARCNHSLYGYYDRFWEPNPARPECFVEQKPDWFAQGYEGKPRQMCYTNPDLVRQVAQDAREYFSGQKTGAQLGIFWNPALPNPFPVEPMDNSSFCKCDRCQVWLAKKLGDVPHYSRGLHSEYFFQFVNAVAKSRSDAPFITLAYMTHAYPPASFRLEPNVAVAFCFAWNRAPYHEEYAHELGLLKQWAKQKRSLYMWLYDTFPVEIANNGKFHCWPGFFAHTLGEQMKLFHKLGVRGFFHCGYGQEVEAYLTYRLMDDVTLDVDALLDDYFTRLYGPAGQPLQEFYRLVEATYCNPANYAKTDRHQTMQIAWGKLGTPERMAKLGRLMEQAQVSAVTDLQKKRVALFEQSVWNYLLAGRKQYEQRTATAIPSVRVARLPAAQGDAARLDWSKATALPGSWHVSNQYQPAARPLTARLAQDGEFLYLELTDPVAPARLQSSAAVFPHDTWEVFVAAQRAQPYRQYAVGPSGLTTCLSFGEVNWQQGFKMEGLNWRAVSDTTAADRWVTRLVFPLASVVPGGVKPGGKLFLNLARVTNPELAGAGRLAIETWVPLSALHEADRLAQVTLE